MTLAQAEAFLILADELHFGRTAERLFLSQPRVSRMIASLEVEVGGLLFERTSRRVRITPLGEQLRDRLRTAIDLLEAGLAETRAAARGTTGTLRIGFTPTTRLEALTRTIVAFEASHPDCEIVEREVPLMDPYTALRGNEIDILCNWLALDEPDLKGGPVIHEEERIVAVSTTHPFASRDAVSAEELGGEAVCHPKGLPQALWEAIVPSTTPRNVPIRRTVEVATPNEIFALVARGRIVHPTVRSVASLYPRPGVAFVPIHDMAPLPLGLIWVAAHENARIRAFAQLGEALAARDEGHAATDAPSASIVAQLAVDRAERAPQDSGSDG
ncbi:MAG TPA: LysR substrate-binding domain-containing protein [Thermoleophilaceae bacterium]